MEWTPKPCEWLAKLQETPQTKLLLFVSYSKMQWNSEEHVKRTIRISWTFDMSFKYLLKQRWDWIPLFSRKGTEVPRSGGGSKHAKRCVWKSEEPTHKQKCRRPNRTDMMIVRPKLPRLAFDRPHWITQIDGCNKFVPFDLDRHCHESALTWSIWSTEGFSRWTIRIS